MFTFYNMMSFLVAQYSPAVPSAPGLLQSLLVPLLVALITATVGFFWVLAYKHPRAFKTVSAPFGFVFIMSLLLSLAFGFCALLISDKIEVISLDDVFPIKDHELRDQIVRLLNAKIASYQHIAFYVAGAGAIGIFFLLFFAWVSRIVQRDRLATSDSARVKPAKPAGTTELDIRSAVWGVDAWTADVTDVIRAKISDGKLGVRATISDLGIDPCPGARKSLTVEYSYRGKQYSRRVREGQTLSIP